MLNLHFSTGVYTGKGTEDEEGHCFGHQLSRRDYEGIGDLVLELDNFLMAAFIASGEQTEQHLLVFAWSFAREAGPRYSEECVVLLSLRCWGSPVEFRLYVYPNDTKHGLSTLAPPLP